MAALRASDSKTNRPTYDSSGLITGYGRSYSTGADYPVYNPATSQYESINTGKKWTGLLPGQEEAAPPVAPQFSVTKTVKQPEVASAIQTLLANQHAQAEETNKSFQDYLKEAREQNAASKQQLVKDQAAFDTTGTAAQLATTNRDYRASQDQVTADTAKANEDYAAQTKATIEKLNAENAAYESAAQAVADRAVRFAQNRNNLYQLGTGTPTSNSGYLTNRAIHAFEDVNVPLQRELSARRYSQTANIEAPFDRENFGNDAALLGRRSTLAADYANREADTTRYLQDLRMRVAGMSRAQAQDYLRNLGLPLEVASRILAGEIGNVGALQALDERANFYTINTPFDASRLPDVPYYPTSYPPRSYRPSALDPTLTGPLTADRSYTRTPQPRIPTIVDNEYKQQTGVWPWEDRNFSEYAYNAIKERYNPMVNSDPTYLRPNPVVGPTQEQQVNSDWEDAAYWG